MGQQPNIELEMADLPRPTSQPGAARRWSPDRPGDLAGPGDVPWGGVFGTIGPDTGYGLRLVRQRAIGLAGGEHLHNVEVGIAAVAAARASHFGRAPTPGDIDVAMTILGYLPEGMPPVLIEGLAADRVGWMANLGHDDARTRQLVAAVPIENLAAPLDDLRNRMGRGERLILR
ncbi:MAG: hypothetical protein H0V96_11840 [Acidimicrobiia bacterium]|nr:hypothetical protein [Acidimicrobiia bacterium]